MEMGDSFRVPHLRNQNQESIIKAIREDACVKKLRYMLADGVSDCVLCILIESYMKTIVSGRFEWGHPKHCSFYLLLLKWFFQHTNMVLGEARETIGDLGFVFVRPIRLQNSVKIFLKKTFEGCDLRSNPRCHFLRHLF